MGTRADFYVGAGKHAKWLGSVAWDGYEWAEDQTCPLMAAKTEAEFREAVSAILLEKEEDSSTVPADGWPWPWDTSATTDYVYWFNRGRSRFALFDKKREWPDMTSRRIGQGAPAGSNRSGVILITG